MKQAEQLVRQVEHARAKLLTLVSPLGEAEAARAPGDGRWSVVQVVEHLYLAELSGVAKIWAALEDFRMGRKWTGERPHRGLSIDQIVARTWKEKEVAPPIATPHIGGPLAFWIAATKSLTPLLAQLGEQLPDAALEDIVFPHFLSGPLDARQRLEFLRFHIERHLDQIGKIRAGV